jgi:phosphoglycolate phosphatase
MPKNTIILFDLDGTLIDSTEAILESFKMAYSKLGNEVPHSNTIKSLIGLPLDIMFSRLGVKDKNINPYVQAYKMHYRTIHTVKTTLLPGAHEAVVNAARFAHLGVVTTKTAQYSRELLEYFEMMKYFDVLIGREDVTHPKPHPEPIQKAIKKLPEVAGSAYMIGDTCMDMEAAKSAKAVGVGVLCGYSSWSDLNKCTEYIVDNATEAVNTITKEIKI